ncbi:MAG TPA: hypothetical protein VI893_07695, partial [Thermoplasmata archaeon]|nr:hypothetical protein [Thermoplasmata archaeon]
MPVLAAGTHRARKVRRDDFLVRPYGPFSAPPPPPEDDLEDEPAMSLFQKSGHSITAMFLLFIVTILAAVAILALRI